MDTSLNAIYWVIYKNVRGKNQFLYLARQVYPEHSIVCMKCIWKLYRDRTVTCCFT